MKTKILFLPILFLPLFLNGCIGINKEFGDIRDEVIKNFGGEYKSEIQFSVGSAGISVSSWFVDATADEDIAADILDDVSSVQVGVYKKLRESNPPDMNTLRHIEDKMFQSGWKSIIRSSDNGELTAVYVRKNRAETLDRMFVINLEDDELVLVDVKGDLKEVIATAIREKGMKINM
ncbi:MAG: DUF4252 domain-containing protein [Ignavibacteriaceae bacterium]|jgi:hypothetical protein|nr:DUF4252 domain-containing protein [Ignavibacteriaceae bacterium]MCW8823221.1 DUF4252 domain-containing protein [Ignavibacteriaceae bacterium]MCW8961082.1 DUF4252 domain-containing protein [Ignavibacteriaceae bacterium]MCW8995316.1 DUF4252 domain-containing protein [Psychromonas sp.]MCW9097531.1 DUF4252 domain-containing protein [Ignavibacteriaceae bacterium]